MRVSNGVVSRLDFAREHADDKDQNARARYRAALAIETGRRLTLEPRENRGYQANMRACVPLDPRGSGGRQNAIRGDAFTLARVVILRHRVNIVARCFNLKSVGRCHNFVEIGAGSPRGAGSING